MNILITSPSLNPNQNVSGISTIVNNIIKYNTKYNYHHYILGRTDKHRIKLIRFIQLFKQLLIFPWFARRNKIDLVHQNLPLDAKGILREYVINFWCRLFDIPVILHVHGGQFILQGTENLILKNLAYSLFVNSKQVIVLSELEQAILKEKFGFSNSRVLANSVDTSIFSFQNKDRLDDPPILLYLGRIEKNKGIYELIEALKLLKLNFNYRFILCGAGPLAEYCIEEFEKILGNDFEYKGVVYGEDKINIIKLSNLFILPSYFEGLPMALLETMAVGVVPIVTNVGSIRQVVKSGVNGLLINKNDPSDLYKKLEEILLNQSLYKNLSKNASETIKESYDIKKYMIRLNEIYEISTIAKE